MEVLEKRTYFGIRPYLYEEETLSSYLHRIADLNYITYEDVIRKIIYQTDKRFPTKLCNYKAGYRIDLLPTLNLYMGVLASLLKSPAGELKRHSLFNLFRKCGPKDELEFIKMCSKIYNTKSRSFCPLCIKKNKAIYKLNWQFLWIDVCEKHYCKLVDNCIHCGAQQQYIHPNIGKGLCSNCGEILTGEVFIVKSSNEKNRVNKFMNDYLFLLSSTNQSLTQDCVSNRYLSMVITLLYAAQTSGSNYLTMNQTNLKFKKEAVLPIINTNNLSGFIRILKGKKNNFNLSFPMLYKYLEKMNVSFQDFSNIKVPQEFIHSLYSYADSIYVVPSEKPKCKFQFCTNYDSEKMMLKLEKEKIENKTGYYYSPYICLGCFVQYGYNKKKKTWDNISNSISHIMKIRSLLNEGLSPYKISEITSYTIMNVYSAIGFLLKHSLLGVKETEKYMKKVSSFNNIKDLFKEIDTRRGNRAKELIKKYQIHPINFYYHFFTAEVQQNLYTVKEKNSLKKSLLNQADIYIKECNESREPISIMHFCRENRVLLDELKTYDIYNTIMLAKAKQKKQFTSQKEIDLLNDVKALLNQNKEKVILIKEACEYLGYGDNTIRRYLPGLYKNISELCKDRKSEIFKREIEELKIQVKQIIEDEVFKSGKFPRTGLIIDQLKLNKQFYRNYREVYQYYLELKYLYKFNKK